MKNKYKIDGYALSIASIVKAITSRSAAMSFLTQAPIWVGVALYAYELDFPIIMYVASLASCYTLAFSVFSLIDSHKHYKTASAAIIEPTLERVDDSKPQPIPRPTSKKTANELAKLIKEIKEVEGNIDKVTKDIDEAERILGINEDGKDSSKKEDALDSFLNKYKN